MKLAVTNPQLYFSLVDYTIHHLYGKHCLDPQVYPLLTADFATVTERVEDILFILRTENPASTYDPESLGWFIVAFQNCYQGPVYMNLDRPLKYPEKYQGVSTGNIMNVVSSFPPMKLYPGKGYAELWS